MTKIPSGASRYELSYRDGRRLKPSGRQHPRSMHPARPRVFFAIVSSLLAAFQYQFQFRHNPKILGTAQSLLRENQIL